MQVIVEVQKGNEITQEERIEKEQKRAEDSFCKMAKFVEWEEKK